MIGLIFGETDFPVQILKSIKKKYLKYLIIDLTKGKFKKDKDSYSASIGQFGKIINILKSKRCKKVLFQKIRKDLFVHLILNNDWFNIRRNKFSNSNFKKSKKETYKIFNN